MKKRIFAIMACVIVLLSTLVVCVSAADPERLVVRSYNGDRLFIAIDYTNGEQILWDPMELEYLSLEFIYEPSDTDPTTLYEFKVVNVPLDGVGFDLAVYSTSGSSIGDIVRIYEYELYYNMAAYESGGEVPPVTDSTITPDIDEIVDGVGYIYIDAFISDYLMLQLYGGEIIETSYSDIPALKYDDNFWFDEDGDGLNDYRCYFFKVLDAFEESVTYDVEIAKWDIPSQTFVVNRVYRITLHRSPEGENTWRDQYNELVEKYTKDNVTDWYGLVSYLLRQNSAASEEGRVNGYKTGYAKGYRIGFDDGYADGSDGEITFFGFLKTVMLTPVTMLKEVTNFDIPMPGGGNFNIWGVASFIITVAIVIFVVTKLRGK